MNVSGGELIWNSGDYMPTTSRPGITVSASGVITVNNGTFGLGSASQINSGGTFTVTGGSVSGAQLLTQTTDGTEVFNLSGGSVSITNHLSMWNGTINHTGGTLEHSLHETGGINVGARHRDSNRAAYYNFGDVEGNTGLITGTGTLRVGSTGYAAATARTFNVEFRGYGEVDIANVDNSRRAIADGHGVERMLDMSGVTTITNTYDNGSDFGTGRFGWFAENKGKLILPALDVEAGSSAVNWGEDAADETIDLVNSMRLNFSGVDGGSLSIALLATDRDEADWVDASQTIALYDADASAFDFGGGSVTLTIRYDNYLAGTLGLVEDDLRVHVNSGGIMTDVTAAVDTVAKTITTVPLTSFSQIAVTTAELQAAWITEFSVAGRPTGSELFTKDSTVDVVLTAQTMSETGITGWFIAESEEDQPELISEDWLEAEPANYEITGQPGMITLYAWVKDGEGNVGSATTSIYYEPADIVISNVVITDNENGTATVEWNTNAPAFGKIAWQVLDGVDSGSTEFAGPTQTHAALMQLTGVPEDRYTVIITSNATELEVTWPDRPTWQIPGDANLDCKVDLLDLVFVRNRLFTDVEEGNNWQADVNEDDSIDLEDLITVRNLLGTECEVEE